MEYDKIGLKAGLEVHQQLDTKHKLFCHCSASFSASPGEWEVMRKLRAVTGETGEIDVAAISEFQQGKEFVYKTYPSESCLVETDDEPPFSLNPQALEIALEIALLLHAHIPDEIQIMRKNVIDGSNPSGFQRTAIIGLNGKIDTSFGNVGINSNALEEDSSQILKKEKDKTVFGLSRLGIPLIEIATAPDIRTPEQGKEVAEKLGMILRSSKVKRGLGTIRQDLNVSVKGGQRVEIKGVQDLKGIPMIIEKEAQRQFALVGQGKPVPKEVRKANPDYVTSFLRPLPGAARLYPETDCFPIRINPSFIEKIKGSLPELLEEKHGRLTSQLGLNEDIIKSLEKAKKLDLFMKISVKNLSPSFVAKTLLSYSSEIQKKQKTANPSRITEKDLETIFEKVDKGEMAKDSVMDILADMSLGKVDFAKYRLEKIDLDKEIQTILKQKPGLSFGAYMGLLMGKYKGKVSGDEISKALKKALG